jgi:hypothetical protein
MASVEEKFKRELEIFRTEAEATSQFLFGYFAVHEAARANKKVHLLLNTAPLFWNTALHALQLSALIALGRIFDQQSPRNVDAVLRLAQQDIGMFSKEALSRRKKAMSSNASEWLDEYLKAVYVPEHADFRRLRSHVKKYRSIYEATYREIRHKFYAHKMVSDEAEVHDLFSKASVREIRRLVIFPQRLYETLWHLFYNGQKPVLRPMRHSVRRMRNLPSPRGGRGSVQEDIAHEVEQFLLNASRK